MEVKLQQREKVNLLNFDRQAMADYFSSLGEKPFRATQLLKWIYQFGVDDFNAMTNLSKSLREKLAAEAEIRLPEITAEQHSDDGTIKWLLRLDSGNSIETVFIPEGDRGTLCVSSQVGCALECGFCSTAQQGFNRNLTTAEIISQLVVANRSLKCIPKNERVISNVVLMGMGEPLLNFDNVVRAINIMLENGLKMRPEEIDIWLDAGTPEALLETNRYLLENGYDNSQHLPEYSSVVINPPVYVHPDVELDDSVNARYWRMYGISRNGGWGHSLWEFEIYPEDTLSVTSMEYWDIAGSDLTVGDGNIGKGDITRIGDSKGIGDLIVGIHYTQWCIIYIAALLDQGDAGTLRQRLYCWVILRVAVIT